MILVVDHYDSFTYNLVQLIESLGRSTTVVKSDAKPAAELVAMKPDAVVLSPGPGHPRDVGTFTELLELLPDPTPVLGVCLGHQAIGAVFGGNVVRAGVPMHGKTSTIEHDGRGVFNGISGPFLASRYHSLVVSDTGLPADLEVSARTREDGVIMGLRHRRWPVHGVQFHPESILTGEGRRILRNFLEDKLS
jgi:anthranilate synthase component II